MESESLNENKRRLLTDLVTLGSVELDGILFCSFSLILEGEGGKREKYMLPSIAPFKWKLRGYSLAKTRL